MIIGIPVQDGHEMTAVMLSCLDKVAVLDSPFKVVIIDNGSDWSYKPNLYDNYWFPVEFINNSKNLGYYYPLKQLYDAYPDEDLIGLVHNDLLLYEVGWHQRVEEAFEADPKLGLVGLFGSSEIDALGGRGAGSMGYFSGRTVEVGSKAYQGQDQAAGRRITGLEPSVCLDSLFMMFRREVIPHLQNEKDPWGQLPLAHFYDRIWPIRTIEAGYRVATMGVECDHIGGLTTTGNQRYRNDCIKWLESRGLEYDNPETEMYLIAERRYLSEYRDEKQFLPCIIGGDYAINHLAR